jgi:hypothetical protein
MNVALVLGNVALIFGLAPGRNSLRYKLPSVIFSVPGASWMIEFIV